MAIVEDSSQNLWFGTNDGVSCYDGVSWTTYMTEDGLADNGVRAILEDSSGDLWFATAEGGVSCYDGVSWTTYTTEDGLADNSAHAIIEDALGDLWFATSDGVSRYDGMIWTTYTADDGLAGNSVSAILEDGSGNLWFGTGGCGVSRYDGASWTTYTADDGLADNRVLAILEDGAGDMWFGTHGGLSHYDGVSWTTYTTDDGLAGDVSRAIIEDSTGDLWYASFWFPGGVNRYDGMNWTTYTTDDGLVSDHVVSLLEDSSGNMWFGTWGGLSRYDGVSWTTYTMADGLTHNEVFAIQEDSSRNLWFGTEGGGVSRYDGVSWATYTGDDGLAGNRVRAIAEDSSGDLWFGTWHHGVSRYDGANWTTYTTADGLADSTITTIIEDSSGNLWFGTGRGVSCYDGVAAILEDRSGNLWFGTSDGVSQYDGVSWTTYTTADGLASNDVTAIVEDGPGSLWFGTYGGGASCYDGVIWTTYTTADGLARNEVLAITVDSAGDLWFGTEEGGVSRYSGVSWTTYTTSTWVNGLAADAVRAIIEDGSGDLWFGFGPSGCGVSVHGPDRAAPQTVISGEPPQLTASRTQTIVFTAAYGESWGIRFSHSFDGAPWSEWMSMGFWMGSGLSDGGHVFEVRARDEVGNVDLTQAIAAFEVDATPPAPVIASPVFGEAVRDSISIQGTASDSRFEEYLVDVRSIGSASWGVPDGDYELRLSVSDTLGLTGTALVRVEVDNEAPWAWETSPVMISASSGGDVVSTDNRLHMYFPPHALANDASVSVTPADEGSVPDTLAGGAELVLPGYDISWEGTELTKQVTLEMTLGERAGVRDPDGVLALYVFAEGQDWQRLGGTVESGGASISAAIELEGTYAVFSDSGGPAPGGGLSALSFTPRVFSPSGGFADTEVAISFTLGRSGPVTVKVYNRAGRLVDELVSRLQMNAGANVVRWDGRDGDGTEVPDGLYLVTVDALGEKQVQTLAVVR
jgi:ligand-binding sensor domain-containing protein